jgi:RNA polymerase sigma-70 factor (ECF subfamily)
MRLVPPSAVAPGGVASEDGKALLARAAARDEAAVRRLYREHVARVHRHVARILGQGDGDVEDVVQQVFLAALDGAAQFDGRSSLGTWLLGIATRRALDHTRSRWRRSRWQRVGELVGLGRPAGRPDHAHAARSEAEEALAQLEPNVRLVFVLHEVEGYTLAEIREQTGTPISTLHARLASARKQLDALVRPPTDDDDEATADTGGRDDEAR